MTIRVGINGFGRIGRNYFRALLEQGADIEIVAVNDLGDTATTGSPAQVRHHPGPSQGRGVSHTADTHHRRRPRPSRCSSERDPADIPWGELGVDIVIESTGIFTKKADAEKHIAGGAKKVIISAPAKDEDITDRDGRQRGQVRRRRTTTSSPTPPAPPTVWRRWPRCSTRTSASSRV